MKHFEIHVPAETSAAEKVAFVNHMVQEHFGVSWHTLRAIGGDIDWAYDATLDKYVFRVLIDDVCEALLNNGDAISRW